MRKLVIVQGLQYGSEAKGSISALVARNWQPDTVATAWGPNAGHTVRDGDLHFVSSMLASGALYPSVRSILIGPGSVLDILKLAAEIELAGSRVEGKTLFIHPQAAVLKPEHAELEADLRRIGSTMKGTAQAVISKMLRNLEAVVRGVRRGKLDPLLMVAAKLGMNVSVSERNYDDAIDRSQQMVIEGAQGFSLGIHGQFYPYCTSRDVSTAQVLADCRIPYPAGDQSICIVGVCRSYPIRVANRKSDDGQEYTSGGFYEDQHELDWAKDLKREPELTTVTRLPRRIFSFSGEQIYQAARIMRPSVIALTFCDYLEPQPVQDQELQALSMGPRVAALVHNIEERVEESGWPARVMSLSYGPDLSQIWGVGPLGTVDQDPLGFLSADFLG